jgi:hypothetical protein
MKSRLLRGLVALVAIAAATPFAHAGRSCEQRPPSAVAVSRAMQLAEHTATRLTQSGARVVILARAGQNLSEYGVRYSHLGFAYREGEGNATVWRVVHKLNQCGSARASIYRQGLGEFFLDDLWEYEAAVVVLTPQAQAHLRALLADNVAVARLDTPAYSMVAYPWSDRYQQSNQWAIETLALAEDPAAATRARAQAWLRLHGYEPTTLHLSAFKRLGARMVSANVAFDDHPNEKRFSDRIETVTVDSVFRWLQRDGLAGPVQVIR